MRNGAYGVTRISAAASRKNGSMAAAGVGIIAAWHLRHGEKTWSGGAKNSRRHHRARHGNAAQMRNAHGAQRAALAKMRRAKAAASHAGRHQQRSRRGINGMAAGSAASRIAKKKKKKKRNMAKGRRLNEASA